MMPIIIANLALVLIFRILVAVLNKIIYIIIHHVNLMNRNSNKTIIVFYSLSNDGKVILG